MINDGPILGSQPKTLTHISQSEKESYYREASVLLPGLSRFLKRGQNHVGAVYIALLCLIRDLENQFPEVKELE